MDEQIKIVKRNTIPPLQATSAAHGKGAVELRDFRWHEQLRDFMPLASDFSVTWVQLTPGERMPLRVSESDELIVVYGGSADLVGDLSRTVAAEDVIVVPSGCQHGFIGGPQGLEALALRLGESAVATGESANEGTASLEALLELNDACYEAFRKRAIFDLMSDGTLNDPIRRSAFRDALRLWISQSGALLWVRQATCVDPRFAQSFLRQTSQQLDRGILIDAALTRLSSDTARDPILMAFGDWFTRQMYLLDNVEKVAVADLVIDRANAALGESDEACRFWGAGSAANLEGTLLLLRGESPRTYARLEKLIAEAWDMIGGMTDRVVELTRSAR